MQTMVGSKSNSWKERKKLLPKNWCQMISKTLENKGILLTPDQVSDVRMGKIKAASLQIAVWKEITKIERKEKNRRSKLVKLKKV